MELYGEAVEVLSGCLKRHDDSELRAQRALLRSNTAQVELTAQRWAQAAKLAELSLEEPKFSKVSKGSVDHILLKVLKVNKIYD